MSLFVGNDLTLSNPLEYKHIYIQNQNKAITIILNDIEINHTLYMERLFNNSYECYVNTTRGNYILTQEDPVLHLVNYNKKWMSIGREYSIPLLKEEVDKKTILCDYYSDTKFGSQIYYAPYISQNNPVDHKYKISDRLLIASPRMFPNGLGALCVYKKDNNQKFLIQEDLITIPYQSNYQNKQGEFASDFKIMSMNGFDLLVVLAKERKRPNFIGSVFIYSYRKRESLFVGEEPNFYFYHETEGREILIPRNIKVNQILVGSHSIHLIFNNEILSYYLSYDLNTLTIKISNPYSYIHPKQIVDAISNPNLNKIYILDNEEITQLSIPTSFNSVYWSGTLIYNNLFGAEIPLRLESDASGLVVSSDNIFFLFDNSLNKIDNIPIIGDTIIDYAKDSNNRFIIFSLVKNNNIFEVNLSTKIGSDETLINNLDPSGNIPFGQIIQENSKLLLDSSQNLFISNPSTGTVYGILLNQTPKSYYEIKNYSNTERQTKIKIYATDDSEKVYSFDKNLKHLTLLNRDKNNQFYLEKIIIPTSNVQKYLKIEDQILDIAFHDQNNIILIGVQRNQNSFVLAIDFNFLFKGLWINPSTFSSSQFGYSIDIHKDGVYAVISDPTYPSRDQKDKGILYILDLEDLNLITDTNIRSTVPIGDKVKFSDYNNEILSIGTKQGVKKLSWFTNIFSDMVRSVVLDENVSDAEFFLDSQMILTSSSYSTSKNRNEFYRNHKVNGCFEIMTKQAIEIPQLNSNGNISMLKLGNHHVFYYHKEQSNFYLFDVRNHKKIVEWNDSFDVEKSNFAISLNGNTLAYGQVDEKSIVYSICS